MPTSAISNAEFYCAGSAAGSLAPAEPGSGPLACVKSKRIVFVSHDLSQSGSPLLLVETAVKLRQAGAHVRIVTLKNDTHEDDLAARNNIKVLPTQDSFEQSALADLVIANTAVASAWVDQYLQRFPDRGRSLVWWIHELDAETYAPHMQRLNQVAMALFDSYASLRRWTDTGVRFPRVVSVIYPCVDDQFIKKAAQAQFVYPRNRIARIFFGKHKFCSRIQIRRKLGIGRGDFVLSRIGLAPYKGHLPLVRTVERMLTDNPKLPIKLILVGFWNESERKSFLQGLSSPAQRAVSGNRVLPIVRDLAPYYAASDAFVMNSQGHGENFGRVTTEAMTFKLPVLGTDAGGTPEIVQDGITGLLHPVGDDGQRRLAENIIALMNDPNRARALGEAGYQRILEKFTGARFYAELGSLLAPLLTRATRSANSQ